MQLVDFFSVVIVDHLAVSLRSSLSRVQMIPIQLRVEHEGSGRQIRIANVQIVQRKTRVELLIL